MKGALEKLRKILLWKPGRVLLAVGCCGLLLLALIPLFRLTIYAVPYYDDYNFGRFARAAIEQEQSKWAAISGALDCSRTQWYAWQGTYSSIFFMTLMPAVWGEQYYFLGPVFILLLLLAGSMVFTHVILRKVFRMEKWSSLAIQAVITIAEFMFIYSAQSGFYWYNGGIHYVGMHGFGLLFLSVAICLERAEGRTAKGLLFTASVLLAMITAGSNFVTALQGLLCLLTILLVSVVVERRRTGLWLLPSTLVYIIGFGLNVAAPGNSVRARSYVGWGYGPLESIGRSFLEAVKHIPEYTGPVVLMVMLLLVPMIWQAVKSTDYRFRYPGIVLALSFCLYATGYTPSLYSLGHAGLSRTSECSKNHLSACLLFLNEIYWIVAGCEQLLEKRAEQTTGQLTIQKLGHTKRRSGLVVLCADRCGMSCDLPGIIQSGGTLFFLTEPIIMCTPGRLIISIRNIWSGWQFCPDRKKMCSCRPISSARGFCAWEKSPRMRTMRPTVLWPCGTIKTV